MDCDDHVCHLGSLIGNLHSLDFALRAHLANRSGGEVPRGLAYGQDVYQLPVGTVLGKSDLTNFDSLRQLIRKFNAECAKDGAPQIEESLVDMRNAIAHGRVSASSPEGHLRLIHFTRPDQKGDVRITFNEVMSPEWFSIQIARVLEAIQEVMAADGPLNR